MSNPFVKLACVVCGEDLDVAPQELALLEGYELSITNVSRTEEDDELDQEEDYREQDPAECYMPLCDDCAPKVKIGLERWIMKRIETLQRARDAGEEPDDEA